MSKTYITTSGKVVTVGSGFIDIINQQFGALTVIGLVGFELGSFSAIWLCKCVCSKKTKATGTVLRLGRKQSCGCMQHIAHQIATTTHGHCPKGKPSPEYIAWNAMLKRVKNPKNPSYPRYGGRGIKVCERWLKFENFLADMGGKPSKYHSLDRIDSDGDYTPKNCRWATATIQANNTRANAIITFRGRTQTVTEWAREFGMGDTTLFMRLYKSKWSIEKALTTPVRAPHLNKDKAQANSKTGVKGVCPFGNKFRATITHKRKAKHLGLFDTIAEASQAYQKALKLLRKQHA